MGIGIYFKIAGYVDLDMLNMFAVSTYHLSLIVFEIKDENYYNLMCPVMLCTNQHGCCY
jgi:hypothetical protein